MTLQYLQELQTVLLNLLIQYLVVIYYCFRNTLPINVVVTRSAKKIFYGVSFANTITFRCSVLSICC